MININLVVEDIKSDIGTFLSTELCSDSKIRRWINAAIKKIAMAYNFPDFKYSYTLTTDGIITEYDIPYNIQTFYVRGLGGDIIPQSYEDYYSTTSQTGVCIFGDKFITNEANTWTIYYRGCPELLTSLTTDIAMPELYQEALTTYAVKYGFFKARNFDKGVIYDGLFQEEIKRLSATLTNQLPNNSVRPSSEHNI